MSRLAMVWDGSWLRWTTFTGDAKIGSREITKADMLPEVLRALRTQVGAGAEVWHAEFGCKSTAMPGALLDGDSKVESLEQWHRLHHGPSMMGPDACFQLAELEDVSQAPWLIVDGSRHWHETVAELFPQSKHVSLPEALIHEALRWNRTRPWSGWTFRVDLRQEGGVLVAMEGESLQWVHYLHAGATHDDALYAMVNAAHRGGTDIHKARILATGTSKDQGQWNRFAEVVILHHEEDLHQGKGWLALLESMVACA